MEPPRISPKEHITTIFENYKASARVLQTLTNLSNTVIETALKGQCKFLFEILQNADDAFEAGSKYNAIKLQLVLSNNYLIIQHNGKAFDYNDVERICDYASQIEEVKANDLSKTGYKGLGFKSLFNLSDCIYIYSNDYSFRFDKNFWPDAGKNPWQVIPIWSEDLPLSKKHAYDQPVTFILKITDEKQLNVQLQELVDHPEMILFLHRVNCVFLNLNGVKNTLERKIDGLFNKIILMKNQCAVNTFLSRTYERVVPTHLKESTQKVSRFIFPDKIKNAKEITFTFALCTDKMWEEVLKIDGLCYSTLPTQLHLSLPYHVNSNFILNLDRTQFHENEWNEFLIYQIGYLQLQFLRDLAEIRCLKNFVIELLVRKINHPYNVFNKSFFKGFEEAKKEIAWLPAYKDFRLLKLEEGWIDKIHFFKQNLKNIQDKRCLCLIDYDVKEQNILSESEAKRFDYTTLFDLFSNTYYPQLTENSYIKFLAYLYEISKIFPLNLTARNKLQDTKFLKTKDGTLVTPKQALLEDNKTAIPDFAGINPVDDKYLPAINTDKFKNWLVNFGAKLLDSPNKILRESLFQWIQSDILHHKMNINNHMAIISYLAENHQKLYETDIEILKKKLLILTKSNIFRIVTSCYLPNAFSLKELEKVISEDEIISSCYDIHSFKSFFMRIGISAKLSNLEVFRKCIEWIKEDKMRLIITVQNYKPIIDFLSSEYLNYGCLLPCSEKELLKKMPVLTCFGNFVEASSCFFSTAVPCIQGFENVIEKYKLASTEDLNENVLKFLAAIGVSKTADATHVIRNSLIKWIYEGTAKSRISLNNHHDIVKYIVDHWYYLRDFTKYEISTLRKLPVLTKGDIFREACDCYWQTTDDDQSEKKIPKLNSIISADELVSSEYHADKENEFLKVKELFNWLGVRHLRFTDICDRYCNHLTDTKSIAWFFNNLKKYWKNYGHSAHNDKLLTNLEVKLYSSHLLAKNGKMYPPAELYSSKFLSMHRIDENTVPLLAYENLSKELEIWMGIKQELELHCIIKLQESVDKEQNLGKETTLIFFRTVLEQLRLKDKNQVQKYPLMLLSSSNKLKAAKDLYYFKEEDALCFADSCYLKRIHEMSHAETLELAELCGVNLLPFNQEVSYGKEIPTCDETLKEFYLERLPLIVWKESKEQNEPSHIVLQNLFLKTSSIELYKCQDIVIKYPFGKPVKIRYYFDNLKIYVAGNWKNSKTKIHMHIKEKLELTSDIIEILDMESITEGKEEWLPYQNENPHVMEELLSIEENLKKLLSGEETD